MKKLGYVLLMLLIIILSSCSSSSTYNDGDGMPFEVYKTTMIGDNRYTVLVPTDIDKSLRYELIEETKTSTSRVWIVNEKIDCRYQTDSEDLGEEVVNAFYNLMLADEIFDKLPFKAMHIENKELEVEASLDNPNEDSITYAIVKVYMPFVLKTGSNRIRVSIPVYANIIINNNGNTINPFTNEAITIVEFKKKYL